MLLVESLECRVRVFFLSNWDVLGNIMLCTLDFVVGVQKGIGHKCIFFLLEFWMHIVLIQMYI